MKTFRVIVCLSVALVLANGCDSSKETNSNTDAASSTDTAAPSDAGVPADTATPADAGAPSDAGGETGWATPCTVDSDCVAPTDWCAKMPGETDGYCTIHCANGNADCTYEDWTCNAVGGCDNPDITWCGPPEEIENGQGFLVMCE